MFDDLQQLVSKVIQFWIDLSRRNCIKIGRRGQGLLCGKYAETKRGLGILPYGNLRIPDVREIWQISPMCPDIGSAC